MDSTGVRKPDLASLGMTTFGAIPPLSSPFTAFAALSVLGTDHYRAKGPAAIISSSTRAPGELKLLMQMVVLAGRQSPK